MRSSKKKNKNKFESFQKERVLEKNKGAREREFCLSRFYSNIYVVGVLWGNDSWNFSLCFSLKAWILLLFFKSLVQFWKKPPPCLVGCLFFCQWKEAAGKREREEKCILNSLEGAHILSFPCFLQCRNVPPPSFGFFRNNERKAQTLRDEE